MAYSWLEGSISQLTETISSSIPPDLSEKISSTLSDVPDSVQSARTKIASSLPPDAHDLLEKLTLSSPELTAERDRIDIEERRKESVRNCLAELLPWETRDEERAILVDECREAILALSAEEGTFTGPHGGGETVDDGAGDGEEATQKDGGVTAAVKDDEGETKGVGKEPLTLLDEAIRARKRADAEGESPHPQNEDDREGGSLVPPLLASFDLDAHVGLIDRVLDEDDELVRMHAALSGSTVKEVNFWRNYFHHCALMRLKIGLDLDEIWGGAPPPTEEELIRAGAGAGCAVHPSSSSLGGGDTSSIGSARDETITFDTSSQTGGSAGSTDGRSRNSSASSAAMAAASGGASPSLAFNASSMESYTPFAASPDAASGVNPAADGADGGHGTPSSKASSPASDFELVSGPSASNEADLLDDLDAEIARELES